MRVGILGGTGPAGRALAARLAAGGVDVAVGSRSHERAKSTCEQIASDWPDLDLALEPVDNAAAAAAEVVVVATPWDAAPPTAAAVAAALAGKVVVSMANALTKVGDELWPLDPPRGSVAASVQSAAPAALVVAAFHHLPARSLADLSKPVEGDVLLCSDDTDAVEVVAGLVRGMPKLRPFHAGRLTNAAPVEAFTAVLLELNRRYRARATIRLAGIE